MISGPKYKKARRLGASIFEKTQTDKYANNASRKKASMDGVRPRTEFGVKVLEKQRVRYTYGINERQFGNYVRKAIESKGVNPIEKLYEVLESRLDNVVLKGGFAHTRPLARQLVSHGHISVNGKKVTIPSYALKVGDVVQMRAGSANIAPFANLDEKRKDITLPSWLSYEAKNKAVKVEGVAKRSPTDSTLDFASVLEYYRR